MLRSVQFLAESGWKFIAFGEQFMICRGKLVFFSQHLLMDELLP